MCLQAWARGWHARCYYRRLQHDMEAVGKLVEERLAAEAYRVEGQKSGQSTRRAQAQTTPNVVESINFTRDNHVSADVCKSISPVGSPRKPVTNEDCDQGRPDSACRCLRHRQCGGDSCAKLQKAMLQPNT
eukprot:COSAG06_NODE_1019_length_11057_cov_5.386293_4_plen_131_part_00